MNDFETAARGQRAEQAREFIGPSFESQRDEFARRIVEIATTELDPKVRAEKITSLSFALRILANVQSAVDAAIMDGHMAEKNIIKVENIEKMGTHKRRLFDIAPFA